MPPHRSALRTSDELLIRAVYAEHGGAMLGYATKLTGDRAAAEDVVQETLIRAWRHPHVLTNGAGSVRSWLLTVARRLVIDRARARAALREVAESPATQAVQRDHATAVVDAVTVHEALDTLSPERRAVLVQLYFRGCSVQAAAEALGIPAGTVKSRTHHAMQSLRAVLCS